MGTGWILVWIALVVVPPLALAGLLPGYYGIRPPQASTVTRPVRDDMGTVCPAHCQATSTIIDVLKTRVHAA